MIHEKGETLPRHLHAEGFFALVLRGSYVEAGDTGRHRVKAGDVIVHRPFERHLDSVARAGAEVLVLPLAARWDKSVLGRVADPDEIAKVAERDVIAARATLLDELVETSPAIEDWPDLLALDLIAKPDLSLFAWARLHGLHPGSLARGFRQQFDISPDSFRTVVRAREAIDSVISSRGPLSEIASEHGFADQAHMSRTLKRLTGLSPGALRLRVQRGREASNGVAAV